jgi:hypothetical protein
MGRSIRILVANRPKLMRELMLATLSDEPGIEIVGKYPTRRKFASECGRRRRTFW